MKILLSAYACEPNKGSEPGVGWHWALEIAKRGHEVWVITRQNNKKSICNYFENYIQPSNLNFIYFDYPFWMIFWKRKNFGVHLYYFIWQLGILSLARKKHRELNFDAVHHITFVTIHQPSFLYKLKNVNFIYGPAAGGDIIKSIHLRSFPLSLHIREMVRLFQNKLLKYDWFRIKMFRNAKLIFCNSNQTASFLPETVKEKVNINLAIGIAQQDIIGSELYKLSRKNLLFVGNFLHIKGFHLLLKAFENLIENDDYTLTLVGKGKFEMEISEKAKKNIKIIEWISQNELMTIYEKYDLFVFPSLRDSGGMAVLEAMAKGLPVVCFNQGGPGVTVNSKSGISIDLQNKTEEQLINDLENAINLISNNQEMYNSLSKGARRRAEEFTWGSIVNSVYTKIESL